MTGGHKVGTVVRNTANGKYNGEEGRVEVVTKKMYKVVLFADEKGHWFRRGNVARAYPLREDIRSEEDTRLEGTMPEEARSEGTMPEEALLSVLPTQ